MFKDCKTIQTLNQKRVELASKGKFPIEDINVAYNIRRQEILEKREDFPKLEKYEREIKLVSDYFATLSIAGPSDNNNTIVFKDGKFFI